VPDHRSGIEKASRRSSFVAEPMRYKRLFAGDAAHIVPPTGARGQQRRAGHLLSLSRPGGSLSNGDDTRRRLFDKALHGWKAQRFSWWMTTLLHRFASIP
jgi:p-hydroxybenzoate 3-monooxygenase